MASVMCAVAAFMIAATMVHAAASEVPHVTKEHSKKTARQLGKSFMTDPTSLLTELEGMVHSGEAPAFDLVSMIKNIILDDILPNLQTTRDVAANETTDHLEAIETCNEDFRKRAIDIEEGIQVKVNDERSVHAACRDQQKSMHYHNLTSNQSYCVKLGKFLHGVKPIRIDDGMTRSQAVNYVKSKSKNAKMCDRSEVEELADKCAQKEEELAIKDSQCFADQTRFETAFCDWNSESEENCNQLNACYSRAVTNYQNHVSKTEQLLAKWNVETAALHKILCYCNVWLSEMDATDKNRSSHNVTQFDVCKDRTYSPDSPDHGTPADKAVCTPVPCHPGDTCFDQEYSSFSDFVATVVPCMETTTAGPR